jgi:repressor LexA
VTEDRVAREAVEDEIVAFIVRHYTECGFAPSLSEIGAHVGLKSKASVHDYLLGLKAQGRLTQVAGKARTLRVVQ